MRSNDRGRREEAVRFLRRAPRPTRRSLRLSRRCGADRRSSDARVARDYNKALRPVQASTTHRTASDGFFLALRILRSPRRRDPERFHLAIEVAALDTEHISRARHVAL